MLPRALAHLTAGLPRAYFVLWAGMLINSLGGFLMTFLAIYLREQRGFSIEEAGLVLGLFGLGHTASGPIGGALADRVGRRKTLILGCLLAAITMLVLGAARVRWQLWTVTGLLGLVSGLWRPAANAAVADLVPPESRTRAFALMYWAINLGFAGAAILAGILAKLSMWLLFIGDASSTLLLAVVVFFFVPETRPTQTAHKQPRPSLFLPYQDRSFLAFLATQLLVVWMFLQHVSTLPLDMRAHGISMQGFGRLLAINGVLIVLLQPLTIRLVMRVRRSRMLAIGALLVGLGFCLPGLSPTLPVYALSIVVWTLGELAFSPLVPTVVADLAPPELRGSYQGGLQLVWGMASLLGPSLGSLVMGRLGARVLWLGCLALGILAGALHLRLGPTRRLRLLSLPDGDAAARREDGLAN